MAEVVVARKACHQVDVGFWDGAIEVNWVPQADSVPASAITLLHPSSWWIPA